MASSTAEKFEKLKVSEPSLYPLHMTTDKKTEMYVKFAKIMIVFHGPVTDERRAAVQELGSKFKYAGRVVSDDTYRKETARQFSPENTSDFYSYFRNRVKKSCEDGYNLIIIDQSMTNSLQLRYYFYLAQTMQYLVLPYPPLVRRLFDDFGSCRKTQAGEFGVVKKGNSFRHLFCGYFLHDVDSAELRDEANLYVQDCFDIPEFYEYISKPDSNRCIITDPSDFSTRYNMANKRQDLAFAAVKIFNSIFDIQKYMSEKPFVKSYGRMSKLYVVGFILSPHTIAARIRLTKEQRELWDMPDELDENQQDRQPTVFPSELVRKNKVDLPEESVTLIASKCNRTIDSGHPIESPTDVIHPRAIGKSCHIVLGKRKGAPVKNIDYDVPIALLREKKALQQMNANDLKPYDLDRCLVRRVGKYWFIYLKETLIVNGLFASCCSIENS